MIKRILPFLVLFLFINQIQAQVPDSEDLRSIYSHLMNDFYQEILTMDSVHEPLSLRQQEILRLKEAFPSPTIENFRFAPNVSWAWTWPPRREAFRSQETSRVEKIEVPTLPLHLDPHSIKNLSGYIGARLGATSAKLISQGRVQPLVIGGSIDSLKTHLHVQQDQIYKIPSLYESWGLRRYLIATQSQIPILAYLVPPSREYLEHYYYLLAPLIETKPQVFQDPDVYKKWKDSLSSGAQTVAKRLGGQFDYVLLGYYHHWPAYLQKNSDILRQKQVSLPSGHLGRFFQVRNKTTGKVVSLLTLGHERTIWGEASAHLLQGILTLKPKGVFFLGSAGSISEMTNVYDVSIPKEFRTKSNVVKIENYAQASKSQFQFGSKTKFDVVHGNTSSPAAQTFSYLRQYAENGIDTLDVEQSLIAEMISQYNQRHGSKILFGAVNIITDKPLGQAEYDLDIINTELKEKAKKATLDLVWKSLHIEVPNPIQCRHVHPSENLIRRK